MPGAAVELHQPQFLECQAPVGRKKLRKATQILRAGTFLPGPRGNPRKWGPGGKRSYGHEVPVGRVPRRFFGDFLIVEKVTRPAGRNPVSRRALHKKALYYRPLIRHGFAVPPSPQGEGF